MKKIVFLVLAFVLLTASNVFAQTVDIIGYGSKQYAVIGEIEVQAKKFADSLADKKFSHIVVEGMADKSGDKAGNEEYGSKRAKDMQAYIAIRFPDAKIIARSLGDAENARQVRITVMEYVQPPAVVTSAPVQTPKQTEVKPIFPRYLQIFGSVMLVLIIVVLLVKYLYKPKKTKNKAQTTKAYLIIEEIIDGYIVKLKFVAAENKWYSPFKNIGGGQFYAKTKADMIGSIGRCIRNPKFSEQFAKLLGSGEIKKQ